MNFYIDKLWLKLAASLEVSVFFFHGNQYSLDSKSTCGSQAYKIRFVAKCMIANKWLNAPLFIAPVSSQFHWNSSFFVHNKNVKPKCKRKMQVKVQARQWNICFHESEYCLIQTHARFYCYIFCTMITLIRSLQELGNGEF